MQTIEPEIRRALAIRAIEGGLLRLKWFAAATRFEIAMRRHDRALKYAYKYGYNPAQPRVPAGDPTGGRWVRVAQGGPFRGGGRGRYGMYFPGSTYGQQIRLDLEIARTENALGQIRRYEPEWKPRTESATANPQGMEGAIRKAQGRAEEAEAYLEKLRSGMGGNFGPPLDPITSSRSRTASGQPFDGEAWIAGYRAAHNMPDLFGRPMWPDDKGTVAVTDIDGRLYFGINSTAPGYSDQDLNEARAMRDILIMKYPNEMEASNIGQIPNDSLFHAESTILLRAARQNDGSLEGREIEIHTDREMCYTSCEIVLPKIGLELGNPRVTYIDSNGTTRKMHDGKWE